MPPARQNGSPDPLDPFPALLSSFRAASAPTPTYASVARSPSTEARPIEPAPQEDAAESSTAGPSRSVGEGWGVQDVDANDILDEIRLFPSSTPPPPAARTLRTRSNASELPPRSSRRAGQAAPIVLGPATDIPRLGSVLSPTSGHRPTATGFRTSSVDPGYPEHVRRQDAIIASMARTANRSRADTRVYGPGLRPLRNLTEFDAARRTWQGGIAAAFQQGYEEHGDDSEAGPSSEGDLNPIPLRRRGIRAFPMPVQRVNIRNTETPYTTWLTADDDLSDENDEHDELERALLPQARRRVRPFYSHPNVTGDIDESEWALVGATLQRGTNNRRRESLVRRQQQVQAATIAATATGQAVPVLSTPPGLEPTNTDTPDSLPVTVQSRGTRRQRSPSAQEAEDDESQDEDDDLCYKRRKTDDDPMEGGRPSYMAYACPNNPDMTVPLAFCNPADNSFLDLSVSSTGRPLIKFVDGVEGLDVTETDADACNLHTGDSIQSSCGVHYFEAECIDQGKEGFMSVGWTVWGTNPERLIGWDKGTWGWHADDGMCFAQSGSGSDYAAKWGSGDTVGCGIDFTTGRAFLTKNGELIGHRFNGLTKKGLFPAVGLRSVGEELSINFTGPFRYDIDAHIRKIRDEIHDSVMDYPVTGVPRINKHQEESDESDDTDSESAESAITKPERKRARTEAEAGDVTMAESDAAASPQQDQVESKLPVISALNEPTEKTTAAFVLDYLRQHSHTSTLDLVGKELLRRQSVSTWPPTRPPEEDYLPIINDINRRLLRVTEPVPLLKIKAVVPSTTRYYHWFQIHQLVYLNQQAKTSQEEDDSHAAIQFGNNLRAEAKEYSWNAEDASLLRSAFKTVPGILFGAHNAEQWAEKRRSHAKDLDEYLRTKHGLPRRSALEQSMRQVGASTIRLCSLDPQSTFIDPKRVLGLRDGSLAKQDADVRDKKA